MQEQDRVGGWRVGARGIGNDGSGGVAVRAGAGAGCCPKGKYHSQPLGMGREGRAWGGAGSQSHHWMSEI